MNGNEAALTLRAKVNKLDTASNRTLRPETAFLYLNEAYRKLVEAKYDSWNKDNDPTSFQKNQKVTDELNPYVKSQTVSMAAVVDGERKLTLSGVTDYEYHLRSRIKITADGKTKVIKDPNFQSLDTVGVAEGDPFNESEALNPIVYFSDNTIVILENGFVVSEYNLTYISSPTPIVAGTGEIVCPFIDDVIDNASIALLEAWESQRASVKPQLDTYLSNK